MSFVKSGKEKEISKDAIVLDRAGAINMQWRLLDEWRPRKDVFALTFGPGVLAALAAFSGLTQCFFFRNKLKLGRFGNYSVYLPAVFVPAALAPFLHRMLVSSEIIIRPDCIVCSQLKAAFIQNLTATLQPMFFAPALSYMIANKKDTIRLPSVYVDFKGLLKYHMKISRSFYIQTLPILVALNTLTPMALTYFEYKTMFAFSEKLRRIEQYGDELATQQNIEKHNIN